jgi:hypothetical protein
MSAGHTAVANARALGVRQDRQAPRSSLSLTTRKRRFAFYGYLYGVYQLHAQFRQQLGSGELKRQIVSRDGGAVNTPRHLFKIIIDMSCPADRKTRSRWSQALRYVWRHCKYKGMTREEFESFLGNNGGVVGCAVRVAAVKLKPFEGRLGPDFAMPSKRDNE